VAIHLLELLRDNFPLGWMVATLQDGGKLMAWLQVFVVLKLFLTVNEE